MRRPSRLMPPAAAGRASPLRNALVALLLATSLAGLVALLVTHPLATIAIVVALGVASVVETRRHAARLRRIAVQRPDESICTFVREFDVRAVDTWVLRAVYEELSQDIGGAGAPFPLHADDAVTDLLGIDPDDFGEMAAQIASRCGRSLAGAAANPLHGKVATPRDLVRYLMAQPRLDAVA
jgi:hypothetical protein